MSDSHISKNSKFNNSNNININIDYINLNEHNEIPLDPEQNDNYNSLINLIFDFLTKFDEKYINNY